MSRVLITGGTGAIGAALVKRLLRDPAYEVRVCDERPAPQWMRESCELRGGELRSSEQARAVIDGCSHIVHVACGEPAGGELDGLPFTTIERDALATLATIRAALDLEVERFVYVSSARVFERAERFPTPEDYLSECPVAVTASASAALSGERACRAAYAERGLRFTICRPFDVYGAPPPGLAPAPDEGDPRADEGAAKAETELDRLIGELVVAALARGAAAELPALSEQTRTPTHVDDVAEGLLLALGSSKAVGEDFNLGGSRELAVAEIVQLAWEASGGQPDALSLTAPCDAQRGPQRSAPSIAKAKRVLGWSAGVDACEGIAASASAAVAASPAGTLA